MTESRPEDCVHLQRKLFGFQVPIFLFLASRPKAKESWEETPEASDEYALMKLDSNVMWPTEKHRNMWILPGIWNNESKVIYTYNDFQHSDLLTQDYRLIYFHKSQSTEHRENKIWNS